jgi:hypothetical protein
MLFEASTSLMSSSSACPVEVSGRTAIAATGIGLVESPPAATVGGPAERDDDLLALEAVLLRDVVGDLLARGRVSCRSAPIATTTGSDRVGRVDSTTSAPSAMPADQRERRR